MPANEPRQGAAPLAGGRIKSTLVRCNIARGEGLTARCARQVGALASRAMAMAALTLLASLAPAVPERPALVQRFLFELCPRVIAGEVDLRDSGQLAALGLSPRPATLDWVAASVGRVRRRVTIGYKQFSSGKRACQVRFGGKDNQALLRSVIETGEARGWRAGPGAAELGRLISFLHPPDPTAPKIMFVHWPDFDGLKPATNATLITNVEP